MPGPQPFCKGVQEGKQSSLGTEGIVCQLDRSDYLKLGNLPVQENGTTPTVYGEKVTGGGAQSNRRRGHVEILEIKYHTLLPLDTCLGVQLLSYEAQSVCMAEATQSLTREAILRDYRDVFSGIGCLPGYMTLSWMTQYLRSKTNPTGFHTQ